MGDHWGAVCIGWWEGGLVGGGGEGGNEGSGRAGGGEAVLAGEVEEVGLLAHCGLVKCRRCEV